MHLRRVLSVGWSARKAGTVPALSGATLSAPILELTIPHHGCHGYFRDAISTMRLMASDREGTSGCCRRQSSTNWMNLADTRI